MATASAPPTSGLSPSVKWSLYAGVYAFLCSTVLLLVLSPVTNVLGMLLDLPTGYSSILLAGPVPFFGAIVWWAVVERRDGYSYSIGLLFGVLTAILTVLFWLLAFATRFGSLVLLGGVLVLFVLVMSLPIALVAGVSLMYARRRLDDALADTGESVPE